MLSLDVDGDTLSDISDGCTCRQSDGDNKLSNKIPGCLQRYFLPQSKSLSPSQSLGRKPEARLDSKDSAGITSKKYLPKLVTNNEIDFQTFPSKLLLPHLSLKDLKSVADPKLMERLNGEAATILDMMKTEFRQTIGLPKQETAQHVESMDRMSNAGKDSIELDNNESITESEEGSVDTAESASICDNLGNQVADWEDDGLVPEINSNVEKHTTTSATYLRTRAAKQDEAHCQMAGEVPKRVQLYLDLMKLQEKHKLSLECVDDILHFCKHSVVLNLQAWRIVSW